MTLSLKKGCAADVWFYDVRSVPTYGLQGSWKTDNFQVNSGNAQMAATKVE